ncbi:MAG: hypothetical protein GX595_01585 [Lentisphaerae bacterium]|nr:hypothetical protein [Lentisphaerota bacterium]
MAAAMAPSAQCSCRRVWPGTLGILCLAACLSAATAAPGALDRPFAAGSAWLLGAQDAGGAWSAGTPRQAIDTLAVLAALSALDTPDAAAAADRARELARGDTASPHQLPARVLAALARDDWQDLVDHRRPDGGWGLAPGWTSDLPDTCLAADALLTAAAAPDAWPPIAAWLIVRQRPDGFWATTDEDAPGQLQLTAMAVRTLLALRAALAESAPQQSLCRAIDDALALALPRLRECERPDGRFSLDSDPAAAPSPTDTAEVYRTLALVDQPGRYATTAALLEALQTPGGAWHEPGRPAQTVYTTAVVLQALGMVRLPASEPCPDLMVTAAGIHLAPEQPRLGDRVAVTAVVFNLGDADASEVEVAFYRGEPGPSSPCLGRRRGLALPARGSVAATLDIAAAGLAAQPVIGIVVDEAGLVRDSNRANNRASRVLPIAGLPEAPATPGIDLAFEPCGVTCNGLSAATIRLDAGPLVDLQIGVGNRGHDAAPAFAIEVRDGDALVARLTLPGLGGGERTALHLPWRPAPGSDQHRLTACLDPADAIPETDETNNRTEKTLLVLGNACSLVAHRSGDDLQAATAFAAFETAIVTPAAPYPGATVELCLVDEAGRRLGLAPAPLTGSTGRFTVNLGATPPGTYTAQAAFRDATTGVLLDSVSMPFTIVPCRALRSPIAVFLSRPIVEGGEIEPLGLTALLENRSNVEVTWELISDLVGPDGQRLGAPRRTAVTLSPQTASASVDLPPIAGALIQPGEYTVRVQAATAEADRPAAGEARFQLLGALHLEVTNAAEPARVGAGALARVRTILRLQAASGATGLQVPVRVEALRLDPSPALHDDSTQTATLTATGVLNAYDQVVADGTRVLVLASYGLFPDAEPPPEAPDHPRLCLCTVRNGGFTLPYRPAGGVLRPGQHSVARLDVVQYFPESTAWFGKTIGTAEVFLSGPATAEP